jgi:CelD/BcsL family acetyltransferase involved in cellulose biosynthesis
MPTIREVDAQDERWQRFCTARPALTLFQSPGWSNVIARTYGFGMRVLLELENENVLGGLPFAHIEDFRGPRRVALAFADNLEPLPLDAWEAFESWIAADDLPWTIRTMCKPTARAASVRTAASHHAIDLPDVYEAAAERFHYKHVQNLKQAQKAGLRHRRLRSVEGVEAFYALHSLVRKNKHRLLPQPRAFFQAIYEEFFPDRGFVLLAEQGDTIVSAMLFLACGGTLYYKFSASALDALLVRPNHFLISKAIELAIEDGFDRLDLGISDTEGLVRFKERIGGAASDVYAASYNPREKTTGVAGVEKAFGDITEELTGDDVPLSAAQRGGEILYRFFT